MSSRTVISRLANAFLILMGFTTLAACGGSSGGSGPSGNNPIPVISGLSPNAVTAGGSLFNISVTGNSFVSSSIVEWNGSARPTTYVSSTQLQAQIAASDIASSGTFPLTVVNPAPGGGTSLPAEFSVNNPSPSITSISPNSAAAGGGSFTLTVTGSGFVPTSTVEWNGSARATTFSSGSQIQAQIKAIDISAMGSASITVANPTPGGGVSGAMTFTISGASSGILTINQASNDLVWDAKNQVIYLSVPSAAGAATGNTISVLNPLTGTLTLSVFAGSEPNVLTISDDSQFIRASVRFAPVGKRRHGALCSE